VPQDFLTEVIVQENQCALHAMAALTLLTAALSRLEAGQLGVVAFGGSSGTRVLHALDAPWTDAAAQAALGKLRFDADNTLVDTPVLDVVRTVGGMLEEERNRSQRRAAAAAQHKGLSQLLLIVGDGHFHEREALRRAVLEASRSADGSENGLLIVFIVLDTQAESVMQLKSVSFEDGKPVFERYLDRFPFPYYLVLQDIAHLPRLLADLLRQWMQLCTQ
jgi:midasin